MLRISEFARAANVTVRTLRFYDEVGLLRPAHVSMHSGYRSYSPTQMAELNRIQAYKDMDFALDEILDLLKRPPSLRELRRILQDRRERLRARVRDDQGKLARIEARLRSLDQTGTSHPLVLFRRTPQQWVVSAREKLNKYDEADVLLPMSNAASIRVFSPRAAPPSGIPAWRAMGVSTAKLCVSSKDQPSRGEDSNPTL